MEGRGANCPKTRRCLCPRDHGSGGWGRWRSPPARTPAGPSFPFRSRYPYVVRPAFLVARSDICESPQGSPCGLSPPAIFQVPQLCARLHLDTYQVKAPRGILENSNNAQQLEYDQHQDYYHHYDDYVSHAFVPPMPTPTPRPPLKDPLEQ